jgi:hypothetical protein
MSYDTDSYCSLVSRAAAEPMAGTAVHARVWFLLQYDGPWQAKATSDNKLPRLVKDWLAEKLDGVGNGRLQFVRQQPKPDGITFFVAIADDSDPRLYRFNLESYADVLALDIPGVVNGRTDFDSYRTIEPLYLICTNGKRDRCCALFGAAVYRALAAQVGPAAWQTTHLGGHRFAPTGLVFPQGVSYGRLHPDALPDFITAVQQDQIPLDYLRGRVGYTAVAQRAEYHLRQLTSQSSASAFGLLQIGQEGEVTAVQFIDNATGLTHHIRLRPSADPILIQPSCGQSTAKVITTYQFLTYTTY